MVTVELMKKWWFLSLEVPYGGREVLGYLSAQLASGWQLMKIVSLLKKKIENIVLSEPEVCYMWY